MSLRVGPTAAAHPPGMSLPSSPGKLPPLEARGITHDWLDRDGQQRGSPGVAREDIELPSLVSGDESQSRRKPYSKVSEDPCKDVGSSFQKEY